ncbi:MAG TPA: tRNA lysidine(34) synthetase TilS, partial [Brevundimonas sp.]|nr:tRNA lysidine(34) synthetase TilS [Brevundimonas sp.]
AGRLTPRHEDWTAAVRAGLSARLEANVDHPIALALSGGGDSMALLQVATDWARENGRRLLALTVDHGLNPESAGWTAFAEQAARAAGADWRGLIWQEAKPATGLPAAARRARHTLIAEAARAAGARVVLFAHTKDDIAEGELMRAEGSTLGRLRDWAPSPVWPEGRGLMLLRPMLGAGRAELRDWMTARGLNWIDDPANEDPKYARSRARASLLPMGGGARAPDEGQLVEAATPPPDSRPSPFRATDRSAPGRSSPLPTGEGSFQIDRTIEAFTLAAVLVCAGGGERTPRGERLAGLMARLGAGENFTATLCGARIEAEGERVLATRESGEFLRRPPPPLPLSPGVAAVWDGRWFIETGQPGWSVVPAAGRLTALSDADRAALKSLPPAVRGGLPVLIRHEGGAPVLAVKAAKAGSLVEQRLALALDRMTHERDLGPGIHGAAPPDRLFSTGQQWRSVGAPGNETE